MVDMNIRLLDSLCRYSSTLKTLGEVKKSVKQCQKLLQSDNKTQVEKGEKMQWKILKKAEGDPNMVAPQRHILANGLLDQFNKIYISAFSSLHLENLPFGSGGERATQRLNKYRDSIVQCINAAVDDPKVQKRLNMEDLEILKQMAPKAFVLLSLKSEVSLEMPFLTHNVFHQVVSVLEKNMLGLEEVSSIIFIKFTIKGG
jgi:hypothetical protein